MKGHIPKIVSKIFLDDAEEESCFHKIAKKTLLKILPENLFSEALTEAIKSNLQIFCLMLFSLKANNFQETILFSCWQNIALALLSFSLK